MELFLPGIATLLIAGLIVFLILPRMGAPILAGLSLVLLVLAVRNHMQLFSSEYRLSTWQERFKEQGSFIIIGALIVGVLFYMLFLFSTRGAEALPANAVSIPNATEVVNTANEAINSTKNAIGNAFSSVVNSVANTADYAATNLGINNKRNNFARNTLANLGNILATPTNVRRN